MSIYLKFPDIKGRVATKNYQDWSELSTIDLAVARSASINVRRMHDRQHGNPNFSVMTITKTMDAASSEYFKAVCDGKAHSQVDIHFCDTQGAYLNMLYPMLLLVNAILLAVMVCVLSSALR